MHVHVDHEDHQLDIGLDEHDRSRSRRAPKRNGFLAQRTEPPDDGGGKPAAPVVTESEEDRKLNEVPVVPSGRGHNKSPPVEESGKECCVRKFDYPVPKSVKKVPKSGGLLDMAQGIGFTFQVRAEFIPKSEDPKCDCACCVFRQYKKFEAIINGKDAGTDKEYTEDCTESGRCYGAARAADPKNDDPSRNRPGDRYTSECVYEMGDSPANVHVPAQEGATYKLTFDFIGRIHDRCHAMAVKKTRRLVLYRAGTIHMRKFRYKNAPPGEVFDGPSVDDDDAGASQAPGEKPGDAWRGSTGSGSGSMPGERLPLE